MPACIFSLMEVAICRYIGSFDTDLFLTLKFVLLNKSIVLANDTYCIENLIKAFHLTSIRRDV